MSAKKKKTSSGVRSVSTPLALLGILLFVSIFAMLGSLLYVGNKRADQQQHVELASEQLILSQSMATQALRGNQAVSLYRFLGLCLPASILRPSRYRES